MRAERCRQLTARGCRLGIAKVGNVVSCIDETEASAARGRFRPAAAIEEQRVAHATLRTEIAATKDNRSDGRTSGTIKNS